MCAQGTPEPKRAGAATLPVAEHPRSFPGLETQPSNLASIPSTAGSPEHPNISWGGPEAPHSQVLALSPVVVKELPEGPQTPRAPHGGPAERESCCSPREVSSHPGPTSGAAGARAVCCLVGAWWGWEQSPRQEPGSSQDPREVSKLSQNCLHSGTRLEISLQGPEPWLPDARVFAYFH